MGATTSNSTPPPFRQIHRSKMKYIHSEETLTVPEGVKVTIKSRLVTVEGPRGKLTKNLNHLAVNFSHPKKDVINIELHHGARKNVATLRTVPHQRQRRQELRDWSVRG